MKIKNNKKYYSLLDIVKLNNNDIRYFSTNYIYTLFADYIPIDVEQEENFGLQHSLINDEILTSLFKNIFARYRNEIAVVVDDHVSLEDLTLQERTPYIQDFVMNLLNKTIDDEEYYYTMLEQLNANKTKLLDRISASTQNDQTTTHNTTDTNTLNTTATNTINMETSGDNVNRVNDTPNYQHPTEEAYEGFEYTTQIAKQTGTSNQRGTNTLVNSGDTTLTKTGTDKVEGNTITEHDTKYLYEKIFDIQKNYKDLLGDWIKSYRQCFIESYNI